MKDLINTLQKKGYTVSYFESAKDAADYLDSAIDGMSVGIGGSMTVKELGIYERLKSHNDVYWHWDKSNSLPPDEIFKSAALADVYLTSANGVAKTGEIINIDGVCNRVAASVYGHKKVYFIVGANKIADTCEGAISRARNIAARKNAQRLGKKTPCVINGDRCYNCNSPERICKNLSLLWEKPMGNEFEVVIINESLGY